MLGSTVYDTIATSAASASTSTSKPATTSGSSRPRPLKLTPSPTSATAPRPLQLATNARPPTPSSSTVAPGTSASAGGSGSIPGSPAARSPKRTPHAPSRRQSSIAYFSPDGPGAVERVRSPVTLAADGGGGLGRSHSLGGRSGAAGEGRIPNARVRPKSTLGLEGLDGKEERAPLTLAEKHADLLSFIAQKEARCMELRTQLATHEAELAELKRKWERIVHRGFDRAYASSPSAGSNIASSSANGSSPRDSQPSVDLSLNMGGLKEGVQGVGRMLAGLADLSAASPKSPASVQPRSPLNPHLRSLSTAARSSHASTSSISTAATMTTNYSAGTRLSQGSNSSLTSFEEQHEDLHEHDEEKEKEQGQEQDDWNWAEVGATTPTSALDSRAAKLQRRKSRDRPPSISDSITTTTLLGSLPTPDTPSATVSQPAPKSPPRIRRSATSPSPASPSSVAPAFATLGAAFEQPVSAWVGTVGRTLEREKNRNLKRASVLLSDVGQSLFAALASPPAPSTTPGGEKLRRSPAPSTASLLDEDDGNSLGGEVMTPDTTLGVLNTKAPVLLTPAAAHTTTTATAASGQAKDDLDEWNW
ncbi:hypothetical protein PUNSTDRAFT_120390 [Punctularia strigosozonata HHB-11173 SS5]|uniref:uncharacterized protein n=1 Tax=Punctularia strigosozonata (strain HHB-11173) TaxID=741275 RepID=UPI0004416DE8|nr:uncharacterized protein PUNSTDRAFT_120390 [Punctularia strigosozonata HHB-11173 SS5]EIN08826.1 hypothetical protein PUNSTDRAFT_120390 [Punctularia strigosozonata HHB-11173 SS5]